MKKKFVAPLSLEGIEKQLSQDHACYVLITCDTPSSDGQMKVKMSYEGDSYLVSYLIEGAQSVIDDTIAHEIQMSE